MYSIENTAENFKKLGEGIEKRNFIIYCKVLYMINNRWGIIEEDSTGITAGIDLLEHRKLLEDLTNNFSTKKISTRKFEKKTRLFCRESIFDNKNLPWFQEKFVN